MTMTLSFSSPGATLDTCGGKGLNLVRLARAGFPVPAGFVILTEAYRRFVLQNGLERIIDAALTRADSTAPGTLEAASEEIRGAFRRGAVPDDVREPILAAAHDWAQVPLAVRSSATAEDLPGLSFAGQQETYLNVLGPDALITAVVECWASLWTARAIGYRLRAGIDGEVALAVVVQKLVPSQVSGVLFTANPLTGHRGQMVIDAAFGLGEALVSGLLDPDHVVLDSTTGRVVEQRLGAKAVATVPRPDGGVETVPSTTQAFSLPDDDIRALVDLGRRVQAEYGSPQDIEWAFADGQLVLLQSRPITSLYPIPEPHHAGGHNDDGLLEVWFSVGAFQGMLQPITPLGVEALSRLASGAASVFGYDAPDGAVPALGVAGERLWARIDPVMRHPGGRRLLPEFIGMVEPGSAGTLQQLLLDPRLALPASRLPLRSARHLLPFVSSVAVRVPVMLVNPSGYRRYLERCCDRWVADVARREQAAGAAAQPGERLAARLDVMSGSLPEGFPLLLPRFGPIMAPGMLMTVRLTKLADRVGGQARADALTALRALPGNVTTQLDLALGSVARVVRADTAAGAAFATRPPEELSAEFGRGALPSPVQQALEGFLAQYGMRGVGEIDLGQPRWRENPEGVIRTVAAYAGLEDPAAAPDAVFARGERAAAEAGRRLTAALRDGTWPGRLRAAQAAFMISRLRGMFGARETPKFTLVRVLGILREGLLASGADLVAAGVLDRADDVFFLRHAELAAAAGGRAAGLRTLVRERRAVNRRESARRQVPRLILSDGETFYDGAGHAVPDGAITGSPVSPGVAEGSVRVVLDPLTADLQPGEILVCPGTDPAWTPLFLTAGGLVTEVGGMMTHGSVVAREYGIPAVVGVHQATTRLVTGQRILLDGNAGTIQVIDQPREPAAAGAFAEESR